MPKDVLYEEEYRHCLKHEVSDLYVHFEVEAPEEEHAAEHGAIAKSDGYTVMYSILQYNDD